MPDYDMHGDESSAPTDSDRPIPFYLTDAPIPWAPVEARCAEVDPRDLTT